MRRSLIAFALASLLPTATRAQSPELEALVDSIVAGPMDAGRLAGVAVGVVEGGRPLLLEGYGQADVEWDVPLPVDAVFQVGSVTKQFTAVAALMLWERGDLDLDADLTTYLPDYDTQGRSVPVRLLFDHTSGIQGYTEMPAAMTELATRSLPRDTLVDLFEAEPFQFEPGEALIYNNSAYFLLGLIIEEISGQSYEEYLEDHVYPTAGMDDTSYCSNQAIVERRSEGYAATSDGLVRAAYLDHTWPYAAGSLCSTVPDLLDWIAALHGGEVLGPDAYELLVTPKGLTDGTPTRYAWGLVAFEGAGGAMIAHGGGINGFSSETRWYPEHDAGVVVLVNTTGSLDPNDVADAVADHLYGTPEPATADYPGDVSALVGEYRGPVRGDNDLRVRVDLDDQGRLVLKGLGPTQALEFLDGATFAQGNARYSFTLVDGVPTRLDVDQVYGHYVLGAGALGPVVEAEVAPEVMARHVGRYDVSEMGAVAEITLDGGSLWVKLGDQPRLRLVPDGDDEYHVDEVAAHVRFEVVDGETVAMIVEQGPNELRAERLPGG
ncbi:MAG: serine hydrolase domain-containing protein [Longimicrobiales bacterium]